jgi:hypothetical protein
VVDAAGAAVAAAPVLMAVNLLPQPSVESTAEPLPGSGNAAGLVPFAALDPGLLRLLADYWIHPSGPDGRFRFPVPMLPHDCLLSVHYRVRPGYGSARLRVEPDATAPDPPAVEIRLRSLR